MVLVQVPVVTGAHSGRGARAWARLCVPAELQDRRCGSVCSQVSVGPVHDGIFSQVTAGPAFVPAVEQQSAGGARGLAGPDPGVPGSEAR